MMIDVKDFTVKLRA